MLSRRSLFAAFAVPALRGQQRGSEMFADAEAYQRFMGRWSGLLAPRLVAFANLADKGRVLDVGSGTGSLAFSVAKLNPQSQVVGIDPSQEFVGYAVSKNPFPGRVSFQLGDAQRLQFPDAAFENTLALLVLNFIPDRTLALAEMSRVTKPGGRIAAAVWDYGAGMRMLRAFHDAAVAIDPSAGVYDELRMPLCRAGELGAFWKQAGLRQVVERPLEITMRFDSFADFWEPFLLGQGPAGAYVRKLDGPRRQALRAEVKRRLPLQSEDAPFSLTARAWAVRGTRF